MTRMKRSFFTLIEVVVALGILGLSITGLLSLLIVSQKRIATSYEKWEQMHMLAQAVEYFMLMGEDPGGIPEEFFPYKGYRITVSYEDVSDEQVPADYGNLLGQLPLKCMVVTLEREGDGKELDQIRIDRISYESAIGSDEE